MEDTLLDSDFVCPLCDKEDVLLDSLVEDEEIQKKVNEFLKDHEDQNENSKRKADGQTDNGEAKKAKVDENEINSETLNSSAVNSPEKKNESPQKPLPMPIPPVPFGMPAFPMPFMPFMPPQQNSNQNSSNQ